MQILFHYIKNDSVVINFYTFSFFLQIYTLPSLLSKKEESKYRNFMLFLISFKNIDSSVLFEMCQKYGLNC